ncbi:MAG: hypothetical protein HYV45_02395 [Candidatus Moranbacteria bacterium]|nr:hypothetical protein [Candidatus Moranbacteria bacterium]
MNFVVKKSAMFIVKESLSRGFLLGLIIAFLGIASVFFVQERFKASADFMVSSSQQGQDYYTATRSAEYMSRVLSEVIYSESFIEAVVNTGRVHNDFLPRDKKDRLEEWSHMLDVKKNGELGFIRVSFAGSSEREVSKVASATIEVLSTKSGELFGNGDEKVNVRLLSGPIIEKNPSMFTFFALFVFGIMCGMFINATWQLMKEEFRFDMTQ